MDREKALTYIKKLKAEAQKRNFAQSVDFIVNLQDLDFKKPEHNVDFFVTLHHERGNPVKVCGLVGPELVDQSKQSFDLTITTDEFEKYQKNKKLAKQLAKDYTYFVAQANIMTQVAAAFGRTLGPRGKMPNPKAGCVVPGNAALKPLHERLQKLVRVAAKQRMIIHLFVGKETMSDEQLADNLFDLYNQLLRHLPLEKNNVKSIYLKLTMGKPIKVE
ncbi:MAG: 50S ribosomal protein L1 [archaeon]